LSFKKGVRGTDLLGVAGGRFFEGVRGTGVLTPFVSGQKVSTPPSP